MPGPLPVQDAGDSVRWFGPAERRSDAPLVLLAAHVDTVPPNGNLPGRREGDEVIGRGAADMKGAVAVMEALAADLAAGPELDLDVGFLFFGREELADHESALLPLFERCPGMREVDLVIVMEPTANALEIGCLGNLNAIVMFEGAAAHSARPWLGGNAIHAAMTGSGARRRPPDPTT